MFSAEMLVFVVYRLLALFVAGMMVRVIWREKHWLTQFCAALVFIPFVLRGLGIK
ncbi:MAG: hypothetical protein U1E56_13680 [Bauldia sp.]